MVDILCRECGEVYGMQRVCACPWRQHHVQRMEELRNLDRRIALARQPETLLAERRQLVTTIKAGRRILS